MSAIDKIVASEGLTVLGWRDVPDRRLDDRPDGRATPSRRSASCSSPAAGTPLEGIALDRRAFIVRKRIEHETGRRTSRRCRARTLVYKGMLTTPQLDATSIPISSTSGSSRRSRSCTHASRRTRSRRGRSPTRTGIIAHNGEINTVKGNRNWMRAREALLEPATCSPGLERAFPICTPGASDTAALRRGARAAAPRRPLAAARGADDDPGGVGEPRVDARGRSAPSTSSTRR